MRARGDSSIWLLGLLFLAVSVGQLVRIQPVPGSSGALVLTDLAVLAADIFLLGSLLFRHTLKDFITATYRHPVWRWSVLFLAWAAVSLLINVSRYTAKEGAVASFYLGRLILVFLLGWLITYLWRNQLNRAVKFFTASATTLLVLGYIQIAFLGDFRFMARYGWDPHVGRMLSTFFDPNYFGVFLVLALVLTYVQLIRAKQKRWWAVLFVATWGGLFLAYSRSAWLVGAIALVGLAFRYSKKQALIFTLIFIAVLFVPNRLSDRFSDSSGLLNTSQYSGPDDLNCSEQIDERCDKSGGARFFSIKRGLKLAENHWPVGVGYNAYGYALTKENLIAKSRLASHSSQGSDSSLVNILATTGVVGLLLYLAFLFTTLRELHRRRDQVVYAAALFWFTLAWLIASFLNNALFYVSILVPWMILLAMIFGSTKPKKS